MSVIFSTGLAGSPGPVPEDNRIYAEVTIADNSYADPVEIGSFYTCKIDGIIEPSISNYLKKCLNQALASGYGLIILMDTPGGLEESMREMILSMLNTEIPVIVFVYPEGARAASAGVFLTYASDIAVMAPYTSIGAAHPVNLGGEEQVTGEMMEKITNDSVAFIKNLALSRERNQEWAEQAVRESVSITASEALEIGVIDITAKNTPDLLDKINGKVIDKLGKTFIINSKNAAVTELEMNLITRFLHIISNPNIAYILFMLGILGIIYEFSQPGLGISGAVGVLLLIIGLYALSILPINYAGLSLIILAVVLFVVDILLGLGGIPSIAGVASLMIGSFLLINTDAPYLKIARSIIISASVVAGCFMVIVIRAVYKAHRQKPVTGIAGILGETATVIIELRPEGQVKISGEIWQAVSKSGKKIKKGKKVKIESVDGLKLYVDEIPDNKDTH
ncbi:MAG: nodulation protein NfeD [Actinobacteria bacterium]|nr:nodulation protein NfeD [Actinomycetota bacterium]